MAPSQSLLAWLGLEESQTEILFDHPKFQNLLRYGQRCGLNRQEAEDAISDCLLAFTKRLANRDDSLNTTAKEDRFKYLFGCVKRKTAGLFKGRQHDVVLEEPDRIRGEVDSTAERRAKLQPLVMKEILSLLNENQRWLAERILKNNTLEEMAQEAGITYDAIKTRKSRLVAKMTQLLEKTMHGLEYERLFELKRSWGRK